VLFRSFLFGYDLYTQRAGGISTASLWSEQRAFGGFGVLSNTGVVREGYSDNGYVRYDTRLTYIDEKRALVATAGDMVTGALDWSNAVRMGGIQFARNFRVRPDLILTPLPEFAGQASVPSAVDLFINGQRSNSQEVRPGPFVLDTAPAISGAGEAVVVTTDATGRRVTTNIPFYVASTLLKPGLVDFSVEAGALRKNYGLRSFSYGMAAASGVARVGVTKRLTIEGQGQISRRVQVAGVGAVFAPGLIGTVNGSIAYSRGQGGRSGKQMTVGYDYTGRRFGFSVQHRSEERRVGKECRRLCRSRWSPYH
jgi:outer membrane usher protein